jgi:4-methylaminobutanoate oxidase (formaldehyde-forming)
VRAAGARRPQSVSDDDVSNDALPFLAARNIEVGDATALAVRVSYVGELGYELYVPQEYAVHVYETLREAGEPHGIADAGYRAIDACRMEKGYLYWSGVCARPQSVRSGAWFRVALEKGEFIGRKALARIKGEGVRRRLCSFTIDGFAPFHGSEAICSTARSSARLFDRLRLHARQDHCFRIPSRRTGR